MNIRRIIWVTLILALGAVFGVDTASAQKRNQTPRSASEVGKILPQIAAAVASSDVAAARRLLAEAFRIAPNNPEAHTYAGVLADAEGDYRLAEKHFSLAARYAPNSAPARNNYGAVLLRLGRRQQAAKEFEASLRLNPNQPSALVNLAQIRFDENSPDGWRAAAALFEKAFALAPAVDLARAVVVTAIKLGDAEKAARFYRQYQTLSETAPPPIAARRELGQILLESGLTTEAAAELEAAHALDAADVETRIALARAYLAQKDIKKAGRLLEAAVAGGVDDARLYAALAEVYQAGGFFENAIPAMRLAIEKDPRSELYRIRYGLLLIDTKAPAAAVIRLEEARRDFPDSPKILLALGIAQQAEGKSAEAQASFERALRLAPDSVPVMAYLASIFDEKGQYAETLAMTERALAVEEKNALLHYLLADTLLKMPQSDAARAEKHLRRALALDARLTQAHLALGRLLARDNRWAEAAASFERAAAIEPDLADAHYQLGRALARLKRAEESKQAFARFKELNDNQTARKETSRRELVERLANTRF